MRKIYDAEMFEAYTTFAKENKLPSLKNIQIVKMLIAECAEIGITVKHPQENTAGRRRYFTGVELFKPDFKNPVIVDSKTFSSKTLSSF